jgi:hypothetical protein
MLSFLGNINNPFTRFPGSQYGELGSDAGPVALLSNVLRLVSVGAGVFAFINIIIAGITYVSSAGNPEKTAGALGRINMSLIGLVIIAGANILAAIIGQVLFGSWTAIINPTIYGPGAQ